MSPDPSALEREIEESRARLDTTIDQIQGRLSVPNLVDEMLGNARRVPALATTYDSALDAVRRNPVPVLLIAATIVQFWAGRIFYPAAWAAAPTPRPSAAPGSSATASRRSRSTPTGDSHAASTASTSGCRSRGWCGA